MYLVTLSCLYPVEISTQPDYEAPSARKTTISNLGISIGRSGWRKEMLRAVRNPGRVERSHLVLPALTGQAALSSTVRLGRALGWVCVALVWLEDRCAPWRRRTTEGCIAYFQGRKVMHFIFAINDIEAATGISPSWCRRIGIP